MCVRRVLCLLVIIICGNPAVGEPTIRNVIMIPVAVPRNYLPASLPSRPLDETLRVTVVVPSSNHRTRVYWNEPLEWAGGGFSPQDLSTVTKADRIVVDFAEPVASVLPGFLRRLYPRIEVVQSQTKCANCDLLLLVEVRAEVINESGAMRGITLIGTITALGDGVPVGNVNGSGTGRVKGSMYWSSRTMARSVAIPALERMLNSLVQNLMIAPDLQQFIKTKAAERARPSDLMTTAKLHDDTAFFPNDRLDAGETARLQLTVKNNGAGPAFGVRLQITTTAKGVAVPGDVEIGDMQPGGTQVVSVSIAGGLDVESAYQKLRIETFEKRGYGGPPVFVEIGTERLKRPSLEIADISLNDSRGQGDGNGQPANGETIEVAVLVRNSGPGDAIGAQLSVSSVPGVEIIEPKRDLPAIAANAVREARVLLRVPTTFAGAELPLHVRVEEKRGAQVAQASRSETWPIELKRPAVEVTYRMYDGNSPESRGDRDGVASNGETLDLAFVPVNRGALAARDVSLKIVAQHPGVTVTPDVFKTGDLPALSEGAAHRTRVVLPRTLGTDALIGDLSLQVAISQRDFAAAVQPIALRFKARRPELTADVTSTSPLVEGRPATFALEVRNRGPLSAEKVQIELTCNNTAFELLDTAGTPTRKLVIDVGTVGAQAILPRISFKAHVRRNLTNTEAPLSVVVSQADFPKVTMQTAMIIQREDAIVIPSATLPASARERPVSRAGGIPATISFQRYQNGDRVREETIPLRFEVQSQTALEIVRMERNHRAIDPGPAKRIQSQSSSGWEYEPSVRLDYGENELQIVVVTAEGISSSRSIILNREKPQGKVWVAVVGVSRYASKGVTDLAFAREDAAEVLAYYREFGVPDEQLIQLLDDQATLMNMKRMLGTDLANRATNPEDTVIIYFAGHGKKEADTAAPDADGFTKYLLPYDANPADLFSSALSMEDVARILQRLRPERVVLIIDSCFSGAAGGRTLYEPNVNTRAPMSDEFLARIATAGKGRVILTASSSQEVAHESAELRHGIFTYYLLQGLRGDADIDGDNRVDVDELYKFTSQNVGTATQGRQNPMKKAPNLIGTIMLGRRMQSQ